MPRFVRLDEETTAVKATVLLAISSENNNEQWYEKTCLRGFRPGLTLNRAVLQTQKMVRGLKFRIKEVKVLYYVAKKGADQLT